MFLDQLYWISSVNLNPFPFYLGRVREGFFLYFLWPVGISVCFYILLKVFPRRFSCLVALIIHLILIGYCFKWLIYITSFNFAELPDFPEYDYDCGDTVKLFLFGFIHTFFLPSSIVCLFYNASYPRLQRLLFWIDYFLLCVFIISLYARDLTRFVNGYWAINLFNQEVYFLIGVFIVGGLIGIIWSLITCEKAIKRLLVITLSVALMIISASYLLGEKGWLTPLPKGTPYFTYPSESIWILLIGAILSTLKPAIRIPQRY